MIRRELGKRIRNLRTDKIKLSQENFALQINMNRTFLVSVESGKRNISIDNLEKIANGLNISLSELFFDIEKIGDDIND